jgi:hypothetical protein
VWRLANSYCSDRSENSETYWAAEESLLVLELVSFVYLGYWRDNRQIMGSPCPSIAFRTFLHIMSWTRCSHGYSTFVEIPSSAPFGFVFLSVFASNVTIAVELIWIPVSGS